ncbi:MAG: AraC family transcriptional regulator [Prevotella sp.]
MIGITLLILLFCLNTFGTTNKKYLVSYLNITNGLRNSYVDDIFQDSNGFIWVCSQGGGLARYDGYIYQYFGVGSSSFLLRSNFCRNVYEDKFHRLWIAFEEGAQVLDLNTMQPVTVECTDKDLTKRLSQLMSENCDRVYCDSQGAVWVLTRKHLFHLTFDEEGRVNHFASMPIVTNPMGGCMKDLDGNGSVYVSFSHTLWHVKANGPKSGKLRADDLSKRFPAISNHFVTDVLKTRGHLWGATSEGLFCNDGRQWHSKTNSNQLTHDFVTSLALAEPNTLMIGTLGGITLLDLNSYEVRQWDMTSPNIPLSSNFINCIYTHNGILWIGTESNGIVKATPQTLQLVNYAHNDSPESLSPNAVNAIYVEPNGTLWVGTVEGGLNRKALGASGFTHYTTSNSRLSHNSVSTLMTDPRRQLWIGTWGRGVNTMSLDHPGEIKRLNVDAAHERLIYFVGALAYDKINNGVWIGANDGLYFYNLATRQLEEPFKECRNVRGCIGAAITNDGSLWMGCLNGMVQIDLNSRHGKQRQFKMKRWRYKLDDPKSGIQEKIVSFCKAKDGTLWLGSAGYGLYKMERGKKGEFVFRNYTIEDGLPNNGVKGIAEDSAGRLWITTDNGLSIFNPKSELFTNFGEEDGLLCAQYYFNSAVVSTQNHVFLGSEKGLTEITGMNLRGWEPAHLCFTGLTVNNQPATAAQRYLKEDITLAKKIYLHESDLSFAISFSALNYGHEKSGTYSYRMKGYESDWITLPPGQHSVRYSTLPAGDYEFEVRYTSGLLGEKPQQISIQVHVSPYFWKSWWFICLLILLIVYGAVKLYRYRIKKLKEEEVEHLFRPIEKALRESKDPEMLQNRIQTIIDNQKIYFASIDKNAKENDEQLKANNLPFMDRIIKCMEKNYSDPNFGIPELCFAMGMSRPVIIKKLKEETGQTLSQFMRDYRLGMARRLIIEQSDKLNIADVAYRVGFNDPKYFTRCFTKRYSITPISLKEQMTK